MKKAHLNKWRQEGPGTVLGAPDDFRFYGRLDPRTGSPAAAGMGGSQKQVSEISSTTASNMEVLDLRTSVITKVKEPEMDYTEMEALDLRTNVRNSEHCSTDERGNVLDLRISNVFSLSSVSPVPSCVPESISDCDTSNIELEQNHTNIDIEQLPNISVRVDSNSPPVDITTPNKMLPMEIIEKFNLIRNLVIASNGLIPSNIDDPGGTKLEVAQEEIVETSSEEQVVPRSSKEQTANGYNYSMLPVKIGALPLLFFYS